MVYIYMYVKTCCKHVCYRALLNECCGISGIEMSKVQKIDTSLLVMVDAMLCCYSASNTIASVVADSDAIDHKHWAYAQDGCYVDQRTNNEYSNQHRSRNGCMLSISYDNLNKTNRKIMSYCRNHTLLCHLRQTIEVKMEEKGKSS